MSYVSKIVSRTYKCNQSFLYILYIAYCHYANYIKNVIYEKSKEFECSVDTWLQTLFVFQDTETLMKVFMCVLTHGAVCNGM